MANSTRNTSWHGSNREAPDIQHRWASGGQELPNSKSFGRSGIPSIQILSLIAAALMATAILVYAVSFYPKKTPLITICLADYNWPVTPNAGVAEDLAGLQLLDQLNAEVKDISERWKNKQSGLHGLGEYLDELFHHGYHRGPVMIYLNGQGIVDANGEPCLLLPGYDPLEPDQWLRMRNLIEFIQTRVTENTRVVLIVDCVKSRRNWNVGVLVNTWQQRMKSLVDELSWNRLQVISAVGNYQINEFSRELQGSAFGHFLRLGLAGFADRKSEAEGNGSGNGDGVVTVDELVHYLKSEVSAWVVKNRGDWQVPELMSSTSHNVNLVTTLNPATMSSIKNTRRLESPQNISLDQLSSLWQKYTVFAGERAIRTNPQTVHYFQHQILYLEQLRNSGRAYSTSAAELFEQLNAELERQKKEPAGLAQLLAVPGDTGLVGTLRTNELLGKLTEADVERLREEFLQISADDQPAVFVVGERTDQPQPQEAFMSSWLNQLNVSGIWPNNGSSERFARLHLQSETAGLPADIRTHAWAINELNEADIARRKAFDLLFTGDASAARALELAEQQIRGIIEDDSSARNRLKKYYRQRDATTARFLSLAKWHTRWRSPVIDQNAFAQQPQGQDFKMKLIDLALHLRAQSLDLAQPSLDRDNLNLSESHREIEQLSDELQSEFTNHCDQLLKTSEINGALVFQLKEVLKIPTTPPGKRKELIEKLRAAEMALAAGDPSPGSSANTSPREPAGLQDRLSGQAEIQMELSSNPLISFLNIPKDSIAADAAIVAIEKASNLIATRIQGLAKRDVLELLSEANIASLGWKGLQKTRGLLSQAAYLQRQSLSLVDSSKLNCNLIGENFRFEMQQALLWQARRSTMDFYGRRADETHNSFDSEFTFDTVASGFYNLAQTLYPDSPSVQQSISRGLKILTELKQTAKNAVVMSVESELMLDSESDSKLEIKLKSNSIQNPELGEGIAGSIAFHLQASEKLKWTPGFFMDYPLPEGATKKWDLASASHGQLVAFFRGHEFQAPVALNSLSGHRVLIEPDPNSSAQVTLVGDRSGSSAVVFILDCSQSMSQSIRSELIGDEELPRLEFAKGVLATMLTELARQRDTRVGIRFFGHRSGWSKTQPSVRLRQESYQGEFPDLLIPENDVELALPVGRFTMIEADKIKNKMQSIKPWGQSPLNLALIQAMNDFEYEPEGTQTSIVVITDGKNYQFSPNSETTANPRLTTLGDVTSQIESKRVPIYILGFGIPENEREEAEKSFFSIAQKSGGKYFAVNSGKELLQAMRNQLKLGTYRVYPSQQLNVKPGPKNITRLYDSVDLPQAGNYRVVADSADLDFEIEGGESLKFRLADGPAISAIPYDREQLQLVELGHESKAGRIKFRAHRPSRAKEAVEFVFSFQFANQTFTPRPKELWIQIKPAYEKNELPAQGNYPYVFYDRFFESKTPVPVMKCKIPSWPSKSLAADIEVFCKYESSVPNQIVPIKSWTEPQGLSGNFRDVEGIPGLQYLVEIDPGPTGTAMIRIVEEHGRNSDGIYSVKVELNTPAKIKPKRIVRQFDTERQIGVHNFFYDKKQLASILDSDETTISFSTRKTLMNESWTQREPMTVRVFPELELLPLDATNGDR